MFIRCQFLSEMLKTARWAGINCLQKITTAKQKTKQNKNFFVKFQPHWREDLMKDGFLCVSTDVSPVSGITVLLSLTVFMLLVAEIMPATSDSVPLIGKGNFYPSVSLQGNRSLYSPPSFHGNWQTVGSFIYLFFAQKGRKGSASCLDSGMKSVEINIKHCWSLFSRCHASDTAPRKFEINSSLGKSCRCRMRRVQKRKTCWIAWRSHW